MPVSQNSIQLTDSFSRPIRYLRLAVTDRCNLRCFYCMPAEGIDYVDRAELLSYEEMLRIARILAPVGVSKIRITGGEPFVRKDLISLLERLLNIEGMEKLSVTTNGILTRPFLPDLRRLGVENINLSLDTFDPERYRMITRRDEFPSIKKTFLELVKMDFKVKINCVVMDGINDVDIIPMCRLTEQYPVSVRFIEEMPFNGSGGGPKKLEWSHEKIINAIRAEYPGMQQKKDEPSTTSANYTIPGHMGSVGVIAAYSRTFCGTCDRIRLTPTGQLRTCLYGRNELDLRNLLRSGMDDAAILAAIQASVDRRKKDGFEAEKSRHHTSAHESMSTIGG